MPVLRRPGQRHPLQHRGDAPATEVTPDRGQALLGPVGHVLIEVQRGQPDHLATHQREERRRRRVDPVALPLLGRDLHRGHHRHVLHRLDRHLVVRPRPQLRPLRHGHDLHPVGYGRPGLRPDRAELLNLAVHLVEAVPLGEDERTVIVHSGHRDRVALGARVLGQGAQQHRADAAPPVRRQHPRGDAHPAGQVGPVRHPGADHDPVPLGQQQQPPRPVHPANSATLGARS